MSNAHPGAEQLEEVLPRSGLVVSEKGQLTEVGALTLILLYFHLVG